MVQWSKILSMQGRWVHSLVVELGFHTMEQLSLSSTTTEPMGSTTKSVCLNEDPHGTIKTQCSQMSELLTNKKDTYGNPGE